MYEKNLKKKYYNNFALYLESMYILLEESITPVMLEHARILLIKFVCEFQDLFGAEYMHYIICGQKVPSHLKLRTNIFFK